MINLLDPAAKHDLRAARINVVLVTYCAIVALAVVTVVLLVLFSHWWLNNSIASATAEQTANTTKNKVYDPVRAQAAAFSLNLGKIQSVLSNRSHYSTALLNLAAALPAGASVDHVSLSPTFATAPLQITATVDTNQAALTLKEKLGKSPIFTKVNLDSVNCGGDNGAKCAVALTATINQQTIFKPGGAE